MNFKLRIREGIINNFKLRIREGITKNFKLRISEWITDTKVPASGLKDWI